MTPAGRLNSLISRVYMVGNTILRLGKHLGGHNSVSSCKVLTGLNVRMVGFWLREMRYLVLSQYLLAAVGSVPDSA